MSAEELRALLLLEALESEDPGGELIGLGERRRACERALAGQDAAAETADPLSQLVARGRALGELARERGLVGESPARGSGSWGAAALVLGALLAGFVLAGLGARRELNVLANPLAGLLAWNWGVILLVLALPRALGGLRAPGPLTGGLVRLLAAVPRPRARWLSGEGARKARLRARLAASWAAAASPLLVARARLVLHGAALAFAAGAVASTYRAGLVLEYRASWESTFLGPGAVHALLRVLLAPGALLSGLALPSAEQIEAIRAPSSGEAARWIHLWAASLAVWVGLPRTLLALSAARRAGRLARELPFQLAQHPFLLRLSRAARGGGLAVRILPYSLELDARRRERLLAFAADLFGARAQLELAAPLPYGAEAPALEHGAQAELALVVVFGLAQTPEAEVHARFLAELAGALRATRTPSVGEPRPRLVVLVDESGLRERLGEGEELERRVAERTRAWKSVLEGQATTRGGEEALAVLVLDLAQPPPEELALRVAEEAGS